MKASKGLTERLAKIRSLRNKPRLAQRGPMPKNKLRRAMEDLTVKDVTVEGGPRAFLIESKSMRANLRDHELIELGKP